MTHELATVTGHPLEHWMMTNTGGRRHQRMVRFHVPTALCDPSFQLFSTRPVADGTPVCLRCEQLIRQGQFDTEMNLIRQGRVSA
jgi:hypothetical protein